MSAEKTEALRLADLIRSRHGNDLNDEAAAELRRLHQFAEDQIGRATAAEAALQMTKVTHALKIAAVEAQRDALLEALQSIADCCDEEHAARDYASRQTEIRGIARAAIKAEEEA
jgi:hypothetical protein